MRAFSLHPGGILTPLQRHLPREEMVERGWIDEDGNPLNPALQDARAGRGDAGVGGDLAAADGMGGVYCEDCDIAEVARPTTSAPGVRAVRRSTRRGGPAVDAVGRADRGGPAVTAQAPIGSGFGWPAPRTRSSRTRPDRQLAIVTGGYSGLGLETTRALAGAGARVVVPARRAEAAARGGRRHRGVEVDELDLADLDERPRVRRAVPRLGPHVDIVINSAGIMACPETRVGPGWEAQFATNHLGHFALVNQLWPAIAPAAPAWSPCPPAPTASPASAGTTCSSARLRQVAGLRPEQDGQRAVRRPPRRARPRRRRARVRPHPGSILTPLQRHLRRRRWSTPAGSTRTATRPTRLQDARAGRGDPGMGGDVPAARRHGRPVLRGLRHRRAEQHRGEGLGCAGYAVNPVCEP